MRSAGWAVILACAWWCGGCQTHAPAQDEPERVVGSPTRADAPTQEAPSTKRWTLAGGASAQGEGAHHRALWYQLLWEDGALTVRLRLLGPPPRTSLFLPGAWAGRDDFAQALKLGQARCADGTRAMTYHRASGRLDLDTRKCDWVELSYGVRLKARATVAERFDPQALDGGGFFLYAPTVLILPSAQLSSQLRDIPVEVRMPASWAVASTWRQVHAATSAQRPGDRVYGFMIRDVRALRDAFLCAGPGLAASQGKQARVVFGPRFAGDKAAIREDVELILASYTARFGAVGPITALVRSPRAASASRELLWGTGRQGGFVLELPPQAGADAKTRTLIAHEAFHLWNGHELTPSPAEEPKTRWFKEGVTHYMALRALRQLKRLSERDLLAELAQITTRYEAIVARQRAGEALSADEAAALPYDRGVLLALLLDAALREASQGKVSVEDWLRYLLAEARQHPGGVYYSEGALHDALLKVSARHPQVDRLWSRHVLSKRPLPTRQLFGGLGLHWLEPTASRGGRLVPLDGAAHAFRAMFQ